MEKELENKKAKIVIVIGIIVLLVLVVGATFSYYLVTGSNTTTTTAGRATLEKAGTVFLTQGVSNIYLDVTAAQMGVINAGNDYYGMATETTAATVPQNHILATIQASGGENDAIYECNVNYSLQASKRNLCSQATYEALEADDAEFSISYVSPIGTANQASNIVGTYPLGDNQQFPGMQTAFKHVELNRNLTSKVVIHGNTSIQIIGDVIFHNLNEDQNDLAELGVNVSFEVTSFNCNPVKPTLASNGVELFEENNQTHMEINYSTGTANYEAKSKIKVDNLIKNNNTEYKPECNT